MVCEPLAVRVPLINPNEPESILVDLLVTEGQRVEQGQVIASFETTKSTFELTAETGGYVRGLHFKTGDNTRAGEILCYLTATIGEHLPEVVKTNTQAGQVQNEAVPAGLRITQPALALAKDLGFDLEALPKGGLITESIVKEFGAMAEKQDDPTILLIYGGGGHAKSLIDLVRRMGNFAIAGIVDDGIPDGTLILDVPVLGGGELLPSLRRKGIFQAVNAVGGIGSIAPRLAVYQRLADTGFHCVTVVHPRAFIEPTASVAEGCQVFFNAYVGSDVQVGFGTIVNTGAILSHDCVLGEYVNISPGAILAGAVRVGERALVGMGATVNLGVNIGAGARVGNSAVVKADVPENGIVRAGGIWPEK